MSAPLVSVIIPWHLDEMAPYVTLCLDSLKKQGMKDIEVVVYSCVSKDLHNQMAKDFYLPNFRFYHDEEKTYYAAKCNRAVAKANPDSKYLLLGSDDIIFSYGALTNMVKWAADYDMIVNPFCNTDLGFYFHGELEFKGLKLNKFMRIEELSQPHAVWAIESHEPAMNLLIPTPHNCFYATLVPRKVWNRVGQLEEKFKTGYEDTDYCMRAKQHGIPTFFTTGAFIFHFGGATSSKTVKDEDRVYNEATFKQKWNIA